MELTWGYPVTQTFCTKGYTQETYGIQSSRWNSNREQKKRGTKNTKCEIPLVWHQTNVISIVRSREGAYHGKGTCHEDQKTDERDCWGAKDVLLVNQDSSSKGRSILETVESCIVVNIVPFCKCVHLNNSSPEKQKKCLPNMFSGDNVTIHKLLLVFYTA